jgi:TonB family protein
MGCHRSGRLLAVELLTSGGDATMDAAQGRAVNTWSFFPSKLDGLPVAAWIEVPGDYGLQ